MNDKTKNETLTKLYNLKTSINLTKHKLPKEVIDIIQFDINYIIRLVEDSNKYDIIDKTDKTERVDIHFKFNFIERVLEYIKSIRFVDSDKKLRNYKRNKVAINISCVDERELILKGINEYIYDSLSFALHKKALELNKPIIVFPIQRGDNKYYMDIIELDIE